MPRVDLNGDVGEGHGDDAALIANLTSANVACGFHAGDAPIMRATVALALRYNVAVGAHPSFPDLQGFGRREMQMPAREIEDLVIYQLGALRAIAGVQGARLQHVKPHGALFNMAARDIVLAEAIARAAAAVDPRLILVGLAGSQLITAGKRAGLRTVGEGFADRSYQPDGSLTPRSQPGAVIEMPSAVVARALAMARDGVVEAIDGTRLTLGIETICVHGDTPGAADLARLIREALMHAGVDVRAMGSA